MRFCAARNALGAPRGYAGVLCRCGYDVFPSEIFAFKEQGSIHFFGKRINGAVSGIEAGFRVDALAVTLESVKRQGS